MDRLSIKRDYIKFKNINIIRIFRRRNHAIKMIRVYDGILMWNFTNNRYSFIGVGRFKIPNSIRGDNLNRQLRIDMKASPNLKKIILEFQ